MADVIFCDPLKDLEVRRIFRSLSPKHNARKMSPALFLKKVYPKFTSFLKLKEAKIKDKQKKRDNQLTKSMRRINYSQVWEKKVKCDNPKSFWARNEDNINEKIRRDKKNSLIRRTKQEETVSECSFHPKVNISMFENRSVRDLYKWDKEREVKRVVRKKKEIQEEMKKCVSRWRSPQKRKRLNKSVHLSDRYAIYYRAS